MMEDVTGHCLYVSIACMALPLFHQVETRRLLILRSKELNTMTPCTTITHHTGPTSGTKMYPFRHV